MKRLKKGPGDDCKIDSMTIDNVKDLNMWAAIMDCGYQGAHKLEKSLSLRKRQQVVIWIQPMRERTEN